jgi:hypothetical protein
LVYDGDQQALAEFLAALNEVRGISVRLTFSIDLSKETGSALQAGSWWVKYGHTTPDTLTVRINLAAETLGRDRFELRLPKPKPHLVRLRFVPVDTHAECGGGASWSRLSPAPDRPGALWARVHAGLGDEFPILDQDGRTLFHVVVPEATDDRFVLDVRCDGSSKKIELWRDKPHTVQAAGAKYEFYYPTCTVSSASKTTTHKAMLIVTRLP